MTSILVGNDDFETHSPFSTVLRLHHGSTILRYISFWESNLRQHAVPGGLWTACQMNPSKRELSYLLRGVVRACETWAHEVDRGVSGCSPGRIKPRWLESLMRTDIYLKTSPAMKGWWQDFLLKKCIVLNSWKNSDTKVIPRAYGFRDPHVQGSSRWIRFCSASISRRRL